MDPKDIQELMALPQFGHFVDFITKKADELNRLDDIDYTTTAQIALEVKARARAYKKLIEILSPLIQPQTTPVIGANNNDYVIP